MHKIFIVYRSFFDINGKNLTIGGIQTYIRQLCRLIIKIGAQPIIVQFSNVNFQRNFGKIKVYGVKVLKERKDFNKSKIAIRFIKKLYNEGDVIIFGSEDIFVPVKFTENVIVIQHGITWDKPVIKKNGLKKLISYSLIGNLALKYINSYRRLKTLKKINHLVCVDHNFLNYLRTQLDCLSFQTYVIPNSTDIKYISFPNNNNNNNNNNIIKILFARRFEPYRGTRLFANVAKSLIEKFDNVYISFAGSGSDEKYLKETFSNIPRIDFIKYRSEDSLSIHSQYDIAVIPSIGSEGTSLSLLEAMAAKCAVVATNVGGLTNIILDHYNGLLVLPDENDIYIALEKLILDNDLREKISENAYNTVKEAFNIELWEKRWTKVLKQFI